MRVRYAQQALAARNHIIAQRDDLASAGRLYQRFQQARSLVGRFPELGRVGSAPGTRELLIAGTPYLFVYRIEETAIVILDIRHSGRTSS